MEETKELQNVYKIFRTLIYVTLLIEFFVYAMPYQTLASLGTLCLDFHDRLSQFAIYKHGNLIYSKLVTLVMVIITCIGTRNKKKIEFDAQKMIFIPLVTGLVLLIFSVLIYGWDMSIRLYAVRANIWVYMLASVFGTLFIHTALDNASKHLKTGLLDDRFNLENESFEQNEELQQNKYSVNIPMRYYYKGKFRKGWVNIINPFRGTWVVGTPGSGKTFSIIEPFIKQHSAKGFAMVVYDYKFPALATKLYYHYKKNKALNRIPENCSFNIINFVNVEYSRRVNPIQQKYINNLAAAQETAETLIESLQKGKKEGGGGSDQFFQTSAVNFLAACIYFFVNYEKQPYDENGKQLYAERIQDPETTQMKPTGRVFTDATKAHRVEPAYWLGKYSDIPHVLSFLNKNYSTIFQVLETDPECYPLISMIISSWRWKSFDLVELFMMPLRTTVSRLYTKEIFWLLHKDGDDFDISSKYNSDYILLACKKEHRYLFDLISLLITDKIPDGKIWNYENDKEFRWEYYKTIREALNITPYVFESEDVKKETLYNIFNGVDRDVEEMVMEIEYQFVKERR